MSYPLIVLKSGREKSAVNRHPWIFSGGVKVFPKAQDGDIVGVSDNHGNILGYGFFSPNSQIICRLFHFDAEEKFGSKAFWLKKFKTAFELRKDYVFSETTTAYRLLFAEADYVPGIIADVYDDTVVLQLLIKGTERLQDLFVDCFKELGFTYVYFKSKISSKQLENVELKAGWLTSEGKNEILIKEHNQKFLIDIEAGQKTGFFIDQRENRQLLKTLSKGKSVLNTFCYTGGFSVYALSGGASKVVSVDISKTAISLCDQTVALNFPDITNHNSVVADCFDYLRNLKKEFDIIVLDPPAFAKSAKAVQNAARGYKDLNLLAMKKIKPGGLIMTYSCSQNITKDLFQKIVFGAAVDANRNVRIVQHLGQPFDHPISVFHPESEYLKGLLLYVE